MPKGYACNLAKNTPEIRKDKCWWARKYKIDNMHCMESTVENE